MLNHIYELVLVTVAVKLLCQGPVFWAWILVCHFCSVSINVKLALGITEDTNVEAIVDNLINAL